MPNVMGVLRAEIRRLARKETRDEIRALRKQVNALRRRMAEARRRIDSVQRDARAATAKGAMAAAASGAEESGKQVRFSPAWVRSHRKKLQLSRQNYARLVGVTAQTILGWESGRSRPRRNALAVWRSLREKGVRELKAMLAGGAGGRPGARAGRGKRRVARKKVRATRRAVRRARRVVRRVRRVVRRAARKAVRARRRTRRVAGRPTRRAVGAKKK